MRKCYTTEGVSQCKNVEVYLPKNLLNYGKLIELLTRVVEFNSAHAYLKKKAKKIYDKKDSIWKKKMKYKQFKDKIDKMKKTIYGYSIYEADGAFEALEGIEVDEKNGLIKEGKKGNVIPVKIFDLDARHEQVLRKRNKKEIINIMKRNNQKLKTQEKVKLFRYKEEKDAWVVADEENVYLFNVVSNKRKNKKEKGIEVSRFIRIIEERVLIIRFITDLNIGLEIPCILSGREVEDKERKKLEEAEKNIWDTLTLVGQYLVYMLGVDVGIEDEIWISYDFGYLWKWKRGDII